MEQEDKTGHPESDHQGMLPLDFEEQQQMLKRRREAMQNQPPPAPPAEEPVPAPAPAAESVEAVASAAAAPETEAVAAPDETAETAPSAPEAEPPPPPVPSPAPSRSAPAASRPKPRPVTRVNAHVSPGRTLQEVRESLGLSLEEVAEKTRIKSTYLSALEQDRFGELPPPVYVRAYIRSLASFYNLTGELVGQIQDHYHANSGHVVSEEIIMQIEKDKQPNPEEIKKVKRLMMFIIIGAAVVVLLIAGSIFLMFGGRFSRRAVPAAPPAPTAVTPPAPTVAGPAEAGRFDPRKLEQITLPPNVTVNPLPVPPAAVARPGTTSARRR